MRNAKSAKARIALGATLIAIAIPVIASETGGSVSGIDGGGSAGIDGGGSAGIDGGGVHGIDGGGSAGIDGGGIHGIDGGGSAGIDGGGILGIDGGGSAGIDGGGIHGIDGGGSAGIDGGGILGIDGGGIRGIDGGGSAGIDGGGIHGIDGGGSAGIDGGGIHGIDGGGSAGIDGGGILAGPVDRIDLVNGVFESMGQIVMASQGMLSDMRVGDFVSVEGSVVAPGWLYADDVVLSDTPYVAGATEVFVTGMLTSVDSAEGTARMGRLTIDYTSSLGNGDGPAGSMWSFAGIRPASDGVMISDWTIDAR